MARNRLGGNLRKLIQNLDRRVYCDGHQIRIQTMNLNLFRLEPSDFLSLPAASCRGNPATWFNLSHPLSYSSCSICPYRWRCMHYCSGLVCLQTPITSTRIPITVVRPLLLVHPLWLALDEFRRCKMLSPIHRSRRIRHSELLLKGHAIPIPVCMPHSCAYFVPLITIFLADVKCRPNNYILYFKRVTSLA
jgi:hypothetical protein